MVMLMAIRSAKSNAKILSCQIVRRGGCLVAPELFPRCNLNWKVSDEVDLDLSDGLCPPSALVQLLMFWFALWSSYSNCVREESFRMISKSEADKNFP